MREILFRGKNVDTGKWLYGGYAVIDPPNVCVKEDADRLPPAKHCIVIEKGFADWGMPRQYVMAEVNPETVGQYTGLTDKNGVKIFEGDIVRNCRWGNIYKVQFSEERGGYFPFACGDGCGCCEQEVEQPNEVEVIGNIHDNPELLEGGNGKS